MTETEIVTLPGTANEFNLTRFMPRDLPELVRFSEYASKSGVFGTLTPTQALIVMLQGAELGINPLQALREIPLVNGKPRPSATLVAGLIQRSSLCEEWHVTASPASVTIKAKRKDRGSEFVVNVRIEDVPASLKSHQVWRDNPEDMLVARAIHRMARRAFADILAGIQDADEIDEARVIDVAKVERTLERENFGQCAQCFHGALYLEAGRNGGAYLRCGSCGATFPPPQSVRDAVRGTPAHLTLAGAAEPVLEPGERFPTTEEALEHATIEAHETTYPRGEEPEPFVTTSAPDEPVDAAAKGAILDGEYVVAVPASAENAPIPEPVAPNPRAANQAMRDAIYAHWVRPRPTANMIEMRELLHEFGWEGGESLGDWMLGVPDDKLAAIADGVAGIA